MKSFSQALPIAGTLALFAAVLFPVTGFGQDDAPPPIELGGFENSGSVTTGYRFTDVSGYRPNYQEMFGLNSGIRLLDFSLFGKAQDLSRFADDYSLTLSGIGGDPYASTQLTVRKANLYDLRVNFRQSRYYWNMNDAATLPTRLDGLTGNHNWATVRKMGSVNLLVHATNNLRFSFEYYRNTRDGVTEATRSPDYFGSSATWGAFARANPYVIVAPLREETHRVTGGLDYTRHGWALHYRLGYQSFTDAIAGENAASPQRSINIDDPATSRELLQGMSYADSRRLTTPVSEFSYSGKLNPRLEARGGYLFYRYQGPASLDMSFDGSARTNTAGTTDAAYAVALSTRAHVTEPNHVIDQGFSYRVNDWWSLLLDYRYSRFRVDSTAAFRSVNAAAVATGTSLEQWILGTSTLDFNMAFSPAASLLVRAGVRLMKEDVERVADGTIDPTLTKRIKTAWPIASFYYQPSKIFTLRGDIQEVNTGTPYTAISPHTDIGGRFSVRFRPVEKFYVEDSGLVRNQTWLQTSYRGKARSNAITANYEFNERATVFAGFSCESLLATGLDNFLRGPAPITNISLRDQSINRVWQAGIKASPVKRLVFSFTGNYVRSTGVGQIQGELPIYGPLSFPYATASVYYDFSRVGRIAVQLQRTYYIEEIVTGNNFGAKLLTIAWTHGF